MLNDGLVELPVTLAQDHTLFEILRRAEPAEWFAKTEAIRARGGMALLITHPDYMFEAEAAVVYERFIARFAPDASAWTALPRDVAAWWRRRAASTSSADGGGWAIAGPAARDGRVELVGADGRATAASPARATNGAGTPHAARPAVALLRSRPLPPAPRAARVVVQRPDRAGEVGRVARARSTSVSSP